MGKNKNVRYNHFIKNFRIPLLPPTYLLMLWRIPEFRRNLPTRELRDNSCRPRAPLIFDTTLLGYREACSTFPSLKREGDRRTSVESRIHCVNQTEWRQYVALLPLYENARIQKLAGDSWFLYVVIQESMLMFSLWSLKGSCTGFRSDRLKYDCLAYLPQTLKWTHPPLIENSYEFPKVSRSVLKLDKGYSAIRGDFNHFCSLWASAHLSPVIMRKDDSYDYLKEVWLWDWLKQR